MNTPVNNMGLNKVVDFTRAKLLKEKGFDEKCSHYYIDNFQNFKHDGKLYKTGLPNDWGNDNILQFVKRTNQPHLCNAPTIAEVVMWLYEKHGIFVTVTIPYSEFGKFSAEIWGKESDNIKILLVDGMSVFNTINQAYEEGIIESLKLI